MNRRMYLLPFSFIGILLLLISPYVLIIASFPVIYVSRVFWNRVVTNAEDKIACACDVSGNFYVGDHGRTTSSFLGYDDDERVRMMRDDNYRFGISLALIGIAWMLSGIVYILIN
ncbi:MAG: hypothetical protein R6U61_02930 [Thermoplasmata archaeon]